MWHWEAFRERTTSIRRPLVMAVMILATLLFAATAIVGYSGYDDGELGTGALALVLCGFVALTAGGWLGAAIVFVHGMRVVGLPDEPAVDAVSPGGEDKKRAEGG